MTGGVAVTDSLLQQIIGHGVAARLSARLGEGMLNGILTARLGILAIDVTRPLPFSELPRPALNDLVGILLRPEGREAEDLRASGASDTGKIGQNRRFSCVGPRPVAICSAISHADLGLTAVRWPRPQGLGSRVRGGPTGE